MGSVGRVAVVGGSGKAGRAVRAALARRDVTGVSIGRVEWPRLPEALVGADAVYLVAPNLHADEPAYVAEVLEAMRAAGVTRLAYHSVASPYVPAMPHHLGKARAEDLVRRSGLSWTILQPCAYAQNLLPDLLGNEPAVRVPYDVDRPHALVDLDDVATCAALAVTVDAHVGATYELGGPLVTLRQVAEQAAWIIGRPVGVERLEPATWERGAGAALDPRQRAWLRAMFDWYDAYGFPAGALVTGMLLGRPSASVADVVQREVTRPGADQGADQGAGQESGQAAAERSE